MGNIPLWLCIPFAGLLLCIAIFPLVKGEWWDKNKGWAVLIWSLLFIIPFAVKYGAGETAETVLECIVNDYLSFIVLLFGLFCVSPEILSGRRFCRITAYEYRTSGDRNTAFKLYRYNRCQHAFGTADDSDEFLEKK